VISAGSSSWLRRQVARALAVALVSTVAVAATALVDAPAWAHNSLVSTSPADQATVAQTPAAVVLTFDEPATALGTQIVVTGPNGPVQAGQPQLVDNTVSQALGPASPAGSYTVDWRVTSADGHPLTGQFRFTSTGVGSTSGTPAPVGPSAGGSADGGGLLWGVAILVAALLAAAVVRIRRRSLHG
jgi:methionine-rich copper-binding protein CopC